MIADRLKTLVATILIAGTAGLVSAAPAAADGFSFGVQIGETGLVVRDGGWDRHGDRGWDRHGDRGWGGHGDRGWDRHGDRGWDRPRDGRWDRRDRFVQVCEPVWYKRPIHDRWGNVIKVIRYQTEECRMIRR